MYGYTHACICTILYACCIHVHCTCINYYRTCRNNYPPVKLFEADVEKYVADNFVPIRRTLEREIKGASDLIIPMGTGRERTLGQR